MHPQAGSELGRSKHPGANYAADENEAPDERHRGEKKRTRILGECPLDAPEQKTGDKILRGALDVRSPLRGGEVLRSAHLPDRVKKGSRDFGDRKFAQGGVDGHKFTPEVRAVLTGALVSQHLFISQLRLARIQ